MKKTTRILIVVLILSMTSCKKENTWYTEFNHSISNSEILALKDSISLFSIVESSHIGLGGDASKVHAYYNRLLKIATNKDLLSLSKDSSSVVAMYGIYGLMDRKDMRFVDIFEYYSKNNRPVITQKGCVFNETFFAEEIYYRYYYHVWKISNFDKKAIEYDPQLIKMDRMILAGADPYYSLLHSTLENRNYQDSQVNLIKSIAFEKENFKAITYLFEKNPEKHKHKIFDILVSHLRNKEHLSIEQLDTIYTILITFDQLDIHKLLFQKLVDIEEMHNERIKYRYKNLLYRNGITKDILKSQ